jgi:CRISPR system Cascade subunit CasD
MHWLEVTLKAPLMSFGKVSLDRFSPTGRFPSKSMITGMVGAALGIDRTNVVDLQHLQDHLIVASGYKVEGRVLRDVQNANLGDDVVWTTRGKPASRGGGENTLNSAVRRTKDYIEDAELRVVLGLEPGCKFSLAQIADSFRCPVFPVSIGRKTCLPSAPFVPRSNEDCMHEADTAYDALSNILKEGSSAQWPMGQGPDDGLSVSQVVSKPDLRDWRSGMHRGLDTVIEGVTGRAEVNNFAEEF